VPERTLILEGRPVELVVRRSERARHLRLVVSFGGNPELVVPPRATRADIERMLAEHHGWLARRVAAARLAAERVPRLGLSRPGVVWLGGAPYPVRRRPATRPARAELCAGELLVRGDEAEATRAVERWYRGIARERIATVAAAESGRLGVSAGRLTIRDQRTRWGSCSARGTLSFSWRLVVCPHDVLRYVVVHELCHLVELNHSRAFWRLLDEALPGWRQPADWLRDHGPELHAYRPAGVLAAT
jgi:predicted metal-dependent hydrolase